MKKILYILIFLPFFGCEGFLDEVDQDKLVPEKTDHYAALLLNEFNSEYPLFKSVDMMSDNVIENSSAMSSAKESYKTTYTWQREIEIDEDGNQLSSINTSWQYMYEDIAITNYVIELIDEAMGEQTEIDFVKGEAYFIRALSYFNLLNLYGQPYSASTANIELGVPLRDDIGVESTYSRNTVAEGYALIESDITNARQLLEDSGLEKSIWHPTTKACDLLMSRVMLYQEKWDEVITYATQVIENGRLSTMYTNRAFITEDNSEVLYSYYTTNPVFGDAFTSADAYRANTSLINLYDEKDKRASLFFYSINDGTENDNYQTTKYQSTFTSLGFANLRVAEAYLNRAEAYAQKGDLTNAINDIKALHATRYTSTSDVVYPSTSDEVLAFVLEDRRKELCFEDHHRWFDLRRMKNRPEIKHVFTLVNESNVTLGTETYTLLSDDPNYTLPIPLKERENNPLIRNNERYEKIAEVTEEVIVN